MARYAGDFQGTCTACDEYVELAIGVRTDRPPLAMHFAPGGPMEVLLRDVELATMIDDDLDVRFLFECPLCGGWSSGRATCRPVAEPGGPSAR